MVKVKSDFLVPASARKKLPLPLTAWQKRKRASSNSPPARRTRLQTQRHKTSAAVQDTTPSHSDNPISPPPEEEPSLLLEEHINIPTQERKELLSELADALKTDKVDAAFWACLQVCDIDRLRELISQAKAAPGLIPFLAAACHSLPRLWK
ncbi:hypothetical protein AJ80_05683 [Polytolypa hystricis UAMH7299]|uniref:Uncharacterized protein n=1 Tax=Polytolypa hystricis (strain UAMH7299) TaxID=1447883 RepID=A0A2B7Y2L5_POLH7|nr:hypothetical protein AJ80_05683 [Polytolypa hystricis UAMH7299]